MLVGVPKEIKNHEYRVGLLPAGVRELVHHGHEVIVEQAVGIGVGFDDAAYEQAGARILPGPEEIFAGAELLIKVKEPLTSERALLHEAQTLFTYLHLAPDLPQTRELLHSGATCIAYETVTDARGRLPLLAPMSEVAGRMSVQAGAMCLEKSHGGSGMLLGGVPGTHQARVLILGGGVVGRNAAQMAVGLGARVTIIDRSREALKSIDQHFGNKVQTLYSTQDAIADEAQVADLIIGAALIPGAAAPRLVSKALVKKMRQGSVMVDVAIDQGGCFETSRATTHDHPTYLLDGVVHYCVANMPGAVAKTSAAALGNATLPFVLELADKGLAAAMASNPHLRQGLNIHRGQVTHPLVSAAHGMQYTAPEAVFSA